MGVVLRWSLVVGSWWSRKRTANHAPPTTNLEGPPYWRSAVVLRFGTKPTGILVVSFIVLTSTTETSLVTGLATYAVLPSGVSVTQPAPLPLSSAAPMFFRSGSEYE